MGRGSSPLPILRFYGIRMGRGSSPLLSSHNPKLCSSRGASRGVRPQAPNTRGSREGQEANVCNNLSACAVMGVLRGAVGCCNPQEVPGWRRLFGRLGVGMVHCHIWGVALSGRS